MDSQKVNESHFYSHSLTTSGYKKDRYLHLDESKTILTLKAPITTATDNIHKYFFHCFSEKIRLDVSSEFSAKQRIHKKYQALFFLQKKKKN